MTPDTAELEAFVRSLDKAELHLHLEGSVEPETIHELEPSLPLDDIRAHFHYSGFAGFLKAYVWVSQRLASPEAYALATRRLLEKLLAQNVKQAEITLSAGVILWKKQSVERVFESIQDEVKRFGKVEVGWIFDAIRQFGPEPAAKVFQIAKECRKCRRGGYWNRWRRGTRASGMVLRLVPGRLRSGTRAHLPRGRSCWSG